MHLHGGIRGSAWGFYPLIVVVGVMISVGVSRGWRFVYGVSQETLVVELVG